MGKKHDRIVSELGAFVRTKFDNATAARSEYTEILLDCLRQVRGEYLACETLDPEININMNITSPIVRGIVGLLRDVFGSSVDKPFVVKATPISDLNADGQRTVMNMLEKKLQGLPAVGTQDEFVQNAIKLGNKLKSTVMREQQNLADIAADKMNTLIQDRLTDANWLTEFGDFLYNFVVYPTAVMKAPSVRYVKVKEWVGNRLVVRDKMVRCVENISPFDFYPAPNTRDIDSAEYLIEIRRCTKHELLGYMLAPGFYQRGIERVYTEHPDGWKEERDGYNSNPETDDDGSDIPTDAQGFYDCIGYYGRINGYVLKEFGVDVDDEDLSYEAEVWTVNDIPIKAVLNPDPVGKRPFYAASFEPIPGSFWGECPVTRLRDTQRVCTASVVALVRNMGLASGVLAEVDMDKVIDDDDPLEVVPNTIRGVKTNNTGPAFKFHTVPDLTAQLRANFESFMNYGYEVIGIPRLAFGSTSNAGTIGRTSGGIAMVLNQSSKSVKFGLRNLEERIIEPVIQSFIDYELMFNMDQTIKGDVKVHARGVSGIIEKESQDSKLEWALQSLSPYVNMVDPATNQPVVPPAAIQRMLYNLMKSAGIDTEGIFPDYDLQSSVAQDMASVNPMVSGATLDNRSTAARQAISDSNGPMGSPQPGAMQ